MRIGVMLRDIGHQLNAPGIIVLNIMDQLLDLDRRNVYVLFFRDRAFMERYRSRPNAEIVHVRAPTKLLWDQVAVPLAARRRNLDLLFHPKHSIPLLTGLKTVMQLRGPDYWIYPEFFELHDLLYQRTFLPLYCRKATHLIAESRYAQQEFQRFISIPDRKISTIYIAANSRFRRITDRRALEAAADRFALPPRFALTVTRVLEGKKYYPGKNILNTIEGFLGSDASKAMKFVIVGRETRDFVRAHAARRGWAADRLMALDAVPQEDLPTLYSAAELFLFPSKFESFGIPIVEAMACGCPVITSNTTACPEIAGDAAILVDPDDVGSLSRAIDRLAGDPALRRELSERGLRQSSRFQWSRAALETIRIFEALGSDGLRGDGSRAGSP